MQLVHHFIFYLPPSIIYELTKYSNHQAIPMVKSKRQGSTWEISWGTALSGRL